MLETANIKNENLNGVYSELANLLGVDAVLKIHASYRGQQITFPVELFSKSYVAMQIVNEYDGHNVKLLATKYEYTERTIRKILKSHIGDG